MGNSSISSNSVSESSASGWHKPPAVGVSFAAGMSFDKVCYCIGSQQILNGISLSVEPGEVLCLLGPSGSGKTSLLRIAAGLLEGSTGTVSIDNRVISGPGTFVPPEKRDVGLVFQDYALFPHMTLLQNVEFGLTALGRSEARKQAMRVLSRVGLEDRASDYPSLLSGGEQQRVALARALAPRPGILLMDEPFSGLDSRLRDHVRRESLELLRETRSTAIIVTHDAEEALRVGDKIALIRNGELVQIGSASDLYYNPVDMFAAAFFSEINVLPARISDGIAETALGRCKTQSVRSKTGKAAIRLSDVDVKMDDGDEDWVPGRIGDRRFLGTSELLDIHLQGLDGPIHARVKSGIVSADATLVRVRVDPELIMIFPV